MKCQVISTPTSLTLYFHIGATPAQSRNNLHDWLDNIAETLGGPECLVYNTENVRQKGLFHHLKTDIHGLFISEIGKNLAWASECYTNNISTGAYYSVKPGGMGCLTMVNTKQGHSLVKGELIIN